MPLWEKWCGEREQPTQGSWETVTQMLQLPPWWKWFYKREERTWTREAVTQIMHL